MPAGHGTRARTRDSFSRPFRGKGYIPLSVYLRTYHVGDYVDIKVNSAVQKVNHGCFWERLHARVWQMFWQAKSRSVLAVSKQSCGVGSNAEPHVLRLGRVSVSWFSSKCIILAHKRGKSANVKSKPLIAWLGRQCRDCRRLLQPAAGGTLLGGSSYLVRVGSKTYAPVEESLGWLRFVELGRVASAAVC